MSYFGTYRCYGCKEICSHEHSVLVIDYKGEERHEYVCSEKCFNEVTMSNGFLHHKRYKKIVDQEYK